MLAELQESHSYYDLAHRLCQRDPHKHYGFSVRFAHTLEELKSAYRIVYQQYLQKNYCRPNELKMHFTHFCFVPGSRTFLLGKDNKVRGVLSLIPDSRLGLPLESVFKNEAQPVRAAERKLAEISLFALDESYLNRDGKALAEFYKLPSSFALFKGMFHYARQNGVTDLVIAVHPSHERLYRSLTFQTIGSERSYDLACGNPAVAMHLDIPRWFEIVPSESRMKTYLLAPPGPQDCFENHFEWDRHSIDEVSQSAPLPFRIRENFRTYYPDLA